MYIGISNLIISTSRNIQVFLLFHRPICFFANGLDFVWWYVVDLDLFRWCNVMKQVMILWLEMSTWSAVKFNSFPFKFLKIFELAWVWTDHFRVFRVCLLVCLFVCYIYKIDEMYEWYVVCIMRIVCLVWYSDDDIFYYIQHLNWSSCHLEHALFCLCSLTILYLLNESILNALQCFVFFAVLCWWSNTLINPCTVLFLFCFLLCQARFIGNGKKLKTNALEHKIESSRYLWT